MRISMGRGWLVVVALGLRTAEGAAGTGGDIAPAAGPHFTFTTGFEGDFDPRTEAIYWMHNVTTKRFGWRARNVTLNEIILFAYEPSNPTTAAWPLGSGGPADVTSTAGSPGRSSTTDPTASSTVPTPVAIGNPGGVPDGRVGDDHSRRSWLHIARASDVLLSVSSSDVRITTPNPNRSPIRSGMALYFQATWSNAQGSGESYSRLFTVASSPSDYEVYRGTGHYANDVPYHEENIPESATSSADDKNPLPTSPTADPAGNGGLASGAVIGIAVACGVVGLALVFVLVWYLLRRRQQKKAMLAVGSSYGSGNRAEELMAEKEAGADVDVSPHSPYSDEGASAGAGPAAHRESAALAAGAVGAAAHHQHSQDRPRSFTPYSDRPSAGGAAVETPSVRAASLAQTDEVRVSIPSATPGRATPRALTTPYAHLVEEGMTEDEIRRLEEEERQLDAAIEQAGRR